MPQLSIRKLSDVPRPSRVSRAAREQQSLYEDFLRQLNGNVGELELGAGEWIRSVKVRLRRAAQRLSIELDVWDSNGRVYFRTRPRRGRPRRTELPGPVRP